VSGAPTAMPALERATHGRESSKAAAAVYDLLIEHAQVVLPDRLWTDAAVACAEGRIDAVVSSAEAAGLAARERLDARGDYLLPGLIDIHINGIHEYLVNDGGADLAGLLRALPRHGVTACLPTVLPPADRPLKELVAELAGARLPDAGARMLGLFLEGPYLTCTGAARPLAEEVRLNELAELIDAARPHQAVMAVAPDFPGIGPALEFMRRRGVPMFMTHTRATVEQTRAAIEAGVRHATHLFNVFAPPPPREPGLHPFGAVEAVLADPRVSVALILDGVHVPPVGLQLALRCKPAERVCLISDANRGAGLPPGRYRSFGYDVEYESPGAPARIARDSPTMAGALAGSGLTLDQALRNAVSMLDLDLPVAAQLVTESPARVLGRDHEMGRIAPGLRADLTLLDQRLVPRRTWIGGRLADCRDASSVEQGA